MKFVRALYARRENRMAFGGVAANDQHQVGLFDIPNRARIATVTDRAEQTHGCGLLAVTRTIVDIVRSNHRAGELLHQKGFLVGAL